MAGRELKALIAAYRDRNDLAFRRAANAIIEEEEAKRHTRLAQELRRLLSAGSGETATQVDTPAPSEVPRNRESDLPLVEVVRARRGLRSLVLDESLTEAITEIVDEVHAWHELDAAGVPRRRTMLLYGPPGCGKTSIAEALAAELGRPLAIVRTETVMSSFLGETASNIARVFEFANSAPYVLLFDEFDSLGQTRDDPADHGELRRIVNAVLQLIDGYSGPSILVAATNHEEILDSALWRRFSEVYEVPLPTQEQRAYLLSQTLRSRLDEAVDLWKTASQLDGFPHAAVERTATDALRLALLHKRSKVQGDDLAEALSRTRRRRWS